MTAPMRRISDARPEEERSAAERLLTDLLIEAAPDADALALRRVLAGWVARRD